MSLITLSKKQNGGLLPRMVENYLNTDRFFSPRLFDFNDNFFENEMAVTMPEANIIEKENEFVIELAAPGMKREDIKVEMQESVLTVSAEKEEKKTEEKKNFRRREFMYSSFSRSFALPENLADDKVSATYENGILRMTLPKKEKAVTSPAKQIKVG